MSINHLKFFISAKRHFHGNFIISEKLSLFCGRVFRGNGRYKTDYSKIYKIRPITPKGDWCYNYCLSLKISSWTLEIAAAHGAVSCLQKLQPKVTNVNIQDRSGRSALHHAAVKVLQILYLLEYSWTGQSRKIAQTGQFGNFHSENRWGKIKQGSPTFWFKNGVFIMPYLR